MRKRKIVKNVNGIFYFFIYEQIVESRSMANSSKKKKKKTIHEKNNSSYFLTENFEISFNIYLIKQK